VAEKLLIVTIVYDDYIEIFDEICMRSLFQSGNIPCLIDRGYEIEYIIWTKEEDLKRVEFVVKKYNREEIDYSIRILPAQKRNCLGNDNALQEIIDKGIENDCQVFFLNPDYFYGNDSLRNLISYKFKNKMCIASLHVRVDAEEFTKKIRTVEGEVSNAQLVSLGMSHLHDSWGESFTSVDINNSRISGSAVQQISNTLWAVTFRIPTVFLAKFDHSDKEALKRFDMWDHEWPATLIEQNRYKFTGSSDMFFAVELTETQNNIPNLAANMTWNDEFHVSRLNGETNRNFLVVLRGE
jgi:hypothetical protein